MFAKLLSRRPKIAAAPPRVPDGRRFYVVGDIHGRLDLLEGLLNRIAQDESQRGDTMGELVFLGDLIDRGPHSAQVIARLMALAAERPSTRFILGNHEEVFLKALAGDVAALRFFARIGGRETILSYGVTREAYDAADFEELARLFAAAVPFAHRAFIESFSDMIVEGDYVFVHAGLRPAITLAEQQQSDLRWIREDFLSACEPFEKVVVHGHTIFDDVVTLPHRIGLDTGAYRTGILTAMGFEGAERWIVQESCRPVVDQTYG